MLTGVVLPGGAGIPSLRFRPHFVPGAQFECDAYYLESARIGFRPYPDGPLSWWRYADTHYGAPIVMRYTGLDRTARYRLRVVMPGETSTPARRIAVRLVADGKFEIHPYIEKPVPFRPLEFDIPAEATADSELELRWNIDPGTGGNGRGCQVSEVCLIRAR